MNTTTTMNTGAASLSDERILEHFDMPGLNLEATLDAHDIGLLLTGIRALLATTPQADAAPSGVSDGLRKLIAAAADCISEAVTFEQDGFDTAPMPATQWDYNADQLAYALRAELAAIAAGGAQEPADTVSLTGAQLLEAFQFVAPDHPNDADQLECEVTIQRGNGHDGPGLYCWITEYPEEGAIRLDADPAAASNGEKA
jgi:hypothetical protein